MCACFFASFLSQKQDVRDAIRSDDDDDVRCDGTVQCTVMRLDQSLFLASRLLFVSTKSSSWSVLLLLSVVERVREPESVAVRCGVLFCGDDIEEDDVDRLQSML